MIPYVYQLSKSDSQNVEGTIKEYIANDVGLYVIHIVMKREAALIMVVNVHEQSM